MALWNQLTLSFPQIDGRQIQMFKPGMSMSFRVPEEEPLYLHTSAFPQELPQQLRTEIGQTFHDDIDLLKALVVREFIHHLQDCSFGS